VSSSSLVTALAFGGSLDSQAERINDVADLVDVGFHVSAEGMVQLVWDHHTLDVEGVGAADA
jgi:hypothetical protein